LRIPHKPLGQRRHRSVLSGNEATLTISAKLENVQLRYCTGTWVPDFASSYSRIVTSEATQRPDRIVRWEILKGLPGDGPAPKYFHLGHPTPWAEGFVVRFWNEDGTEWVGNFQGAWWGVSSVFDFPGSSMLTVVAFGACYILPKSDPERYTCHRHGVTSALVDEEGNRLVFAYQGGDLAAYEPDGIRVWLRDGLATDGIDLISCADGIVTAEIEYDYEGSRRTIHIGVADGADIG
jgi:hypothetical protein